MLRDDAFREVGIHVGGLQAGSRDGQRDLAGLGEAGRDAALEEPRGALGVDDEVGAGQVAVVEDPVRGEGRLQRRLGGLRGEPRGGEVLRLARVVHVVVVEDPVDRADLDRRQGPQLAVRLLDDRHRHLRPLDDVLDEREVVIGIGVHQGRAQVRRRPGHVEPEGRATTSGLDREREAQVAGETLEDGPGADLAEGAVGDRHVRGGRDAGPRHQTLGDGLVPRHARGRTPRPDEGKTQVLQHISQRPVLTG